MSDNDVDALTEAWLIEQHQHVRVALDNAGISETLPWDDLSERTKRLRRNQARPVVEFVAARVEQAVLALMQTPEYATRVHEAMMAQGFTDDDGHAIGGMPGGHAAVASHHALIVLRRMLARGGSDVG